MYSIFLEYHERKISNLEAFCICRILLWYFERKRYFGAASRPLHVFLCTTSRIYERFPGRGGTSVWGRGFIPRENISVVYGIGVGNCLVRNINRCYRFPEFCNVTVVVSISSLPWAWLIVSNMRTLELIGEDVQGRLMRSNQEIKILETIAMRPNSPHNHTWLPMTCHESFPWMP